MIWLSVKSAEPITSAPPAPPEEPPLAGAEDSGLDEPPQADRARARPTPAARPPNARLPRARWRVSFMTYLLEQQPPRSRGLGAVPRPGGGGRVCGRPRGRG